MNVLSLSAIRRERREKRVYFSHVRRNIAPSDSLLSYVNDRGRRICESQDDAEALNRTLTHTYIGA